MLRQRFNIWNCLREHLLDGPAGKKDRILWHVTKTRAFAHNACAAIDILGSCEDLEQCRFAGAVRSHEPDVISFVHGEREALKKRLRTKRFGEAITADENRG